MTMVNSLLTLIPAKARILKAAAQCPPGWRSRPACRLFSALARRTSLDTTTLSGNLGIARSLACEVPANHLNALYGRPDLYTGERASLELAARLSQYCVAFVDIGAHIGYFTFYVGSRGRPGLPIYYFEPDPVLFAALERNVGANRLDRVFGQNEAIGASDGIADFHVNQSDTLSGSLTDLFGDRHQVTTARVRVERFSTMARRLDLERACVKVDVEGAEWDFLAGASEDLHRISYLIMEVLGPAHERCFVQALMGRGGFQAYYINDYTLELSIDGRFQYREPEYNWLFCRDEPAALAEKLRGTPLRVRA